MFYFRAQWVALVLLLYLFCTSQKLFEVLVLLLLQLALCFLQSLLQVLPLLPLVLLQELPLHWLHP